jgi:hypothetical protein
MGIGLEHCPDSVAGCFGICKAFSGSSTLKTIVQLDCFLKERFLAAECRIQTWFIDAHGSDKVLD